MNHWIQVSTTAALLGSALVGGIFFAFSSFVMKALAKIPTQDGIRAMQSINVVVLNPMFLGVFFGTAILSVFVAAAALGGWIGPLPHWFFVGALHYLLGTFLVTAFGNVPLNNKLKEVAPESGQSVWEHYLSKWTFLNHIRTACSLIAAFCFTMGLIYR